MRKPEVNLPIQTVDQWEARTDVPNKRVLVVSLGGTIVSHRNKEGRLEPHPKPLNLFRRYTTIHQMASLDFRLVANVDSTNMKSSYWLETARIIAQEQDSYDGILVTHGTDTMAHTAAALRFLLGDNLRVPVVLTGSQLSLVEARDRSDARNNLGDSIATLIAARNDRVNELMIVFGHRILRGNRATKVDELAYAAFQSPAYPDLVSLYAGPVSFRKSQFVSRVDLSKLPGNSALPPIEITDNFAPTPFEFSMNVDFEITDELKDILARRHYVAAIMKSFGAGNIPDNIISAIRELSSLGVPVLIGASHPGAGMNPDYAVGEAPIRAGAVPTGNMLAHTALIKLRILQNRGYSLEKIKREIPISYYGEVG